jgi:hypothetical protein
LIARPTATGIPRKTRRKKEIDDEQGPRCLDEDCALVLIDYQKEMFEVIRSETDADLVEFEKGS